VIILHDKSYNNASDPSIWNQLHEFVSSIQLCQGPSPWLNLTAFAFFLAALIHIHLPSSSPVAP